MPYLDRGSHRLHFEVTGDPDAPPLLLIMGMGFSSRAWDNLPRALAPSFRVIVFDNRGTGRSTATRGLVRMRHMADDAAAVLARAGAGSAFVFGISMGGMIAIELALRHPERVRALALGCTFGGWLRSRKPAVAVVRDLFLGSALARFGSHSRLARILVSPGHAAGDSGEFGSWLGRAQRARPTVAAQQMAAVGLHAATSRLGQLRVPTLVITGDEDRLVPVENSRQLARRIPGARFVELPGAGHCFPLERPAETVRALTEFFLSRSPS